MRPPANARAVWDVDSREGIEEGAGRNHPTMKPVEVIRRPLEWHTKPGEFIYEPFSGSGTALIAAEMTGRRCYALELSPVYVDVAVICWMREAHQFDSLLDYGRWLLEQPEDVYPLIWMPKQVVAAVRAQNKGTPDVRLRDEFYRVQKDVTFLYHLHKQVNLQALQDEEALRLKVTLLAEKLRSLIHRVWAHDTLRVERLEFPEDLSAPLPKRRRKKAKDDLDLDEAIAAWPGEEQLLWGEVAAFQEAVQLISRRYLGGEELLFPQSAQMLQGVLDILAVMRDVYRTMKSRRPPKSEAGFLRWVLAEGSTDTSPVLQAVSPDSAAEKRPDTKATARRLAEHHVLMARAEALEALGERKASIRLVENWVRSQD